MGSWCRRRHENKEVVQDRMYERESNREGQCGSLVYCRLES